ncbi:MAG: 3-oxoacyl-(acyl-carrier-protein) synthase [Hyphomicrobiales bacterium]|nr:3-oxoacyl-(acyl-carrier-protein) synthase [Hyphomicrobiales bacterium]
MSTRIVGLGHHAPERVVRNDEIEARLGLAPGWILARVGIEERRYARADEALTDLAFPAAERALQAAGRPDIGFLLLATSTPDHLLPPSAPLLAHKLGLTCGALDVAGACAGFLHALVLADGLVRTNGRAVLIVAANILSRRIDPSDRSTSALFADAAGAVVLSPSPEPGHGVIGADLVSDGSGYDLIRIPAGGSRMPFTQAASPADLFMQMPDGREVFTRAVDTMVRTSRTAMESAGVRPEAVEHFVPHQANARISAAVERRLGLRAEACLSTLSHFGNSSAATIPFTLAHAAATRGYAPGETMLFSAVGAGLSGGSVVFRW